MAVSRAAQPEIGRCLGNQQAGSAVAALRTHGSTAPSIAREQLSCRLLPRRVHRPVPTTESGPGLQPSEVDLLGRVRRVVAPAGPPVASPNLVILCGWSMDMQ